MASVPNGLVTSSQTLPSSETVMDPVLWKKPPPHTTTHRPWTGDQAISDGFSSVLSGLTTPEALQLRPSYEYASLPDAPAFPAAPATNATESQPGPFGMFSAPVTHRPFCGSRVTISSLCW